MSENATADSGLTAKRADSAQFIRPSFASALPHYLPLGIFPLLYLAIIYGGWWLLPPFLFMSVAGPADRILGTDGRNIDPKRTPERSLFWHNLPVWTWALLWPPTLIFGMWQILVASPFAIWEAVILVFILTMEHQAVFMVGHELIHRRTAWERRVAEFLLASGSYPQYATEHVYVHHALVGTPNDVGSAPKGESFWRYFPKEVLSNFTSSWLAAKDRLVRRHHPVWHYSNPFWRYAVALAFWYGVVYWMGGIWAVLVFVFLGFCCVFSMKLINYCQHYGLRRIRLPNGRWEKVMPRHSWDADWKFSNWMFFNMQRHSDHHAMASRHYPLLQVRGADESPQLPGTYSDMMNLVLRPKRWFEKMDPLVDQWREHFYPEITDWRAYDSTLAASQPESFDAILEIFGVAPRLARWIESNPQLLNNLSDREFTDLDLPKGFGPDMAYESTARRGLTRLYWTHEMSVPVMREQIDEFPSADAKDTAEIVRNWSNDKAFQVGMHVIRGNLTPSEAATALSNLAEVIISTLMDAVVADHVERNGPLLGTGIATILLGDLASREAHPGIDINLLLVHDDERTGDSERLSRQFRTHLATIAKESLLFSPISGGVNACTELSIGELAQHFSVRAEVGEVDLTRARCIFECGDTALGLRFDEARRKSLTDYRTNQKLIKKLRYGSRETIAPALVAYENMLGGLTDLESTARLLQLIDTRIGDGEPAPTATNIFEQVGASALAGASTLWRNLMGIHRLIGDQGLDVSNAGSDVKSLIALACDFDDFDSLRSAIPNIARNVTQETESILSSS